MRKDIQSRNPWLPIFFSCVAGATTAVLGIAVTNLTGRDLTFPTAVSVESELIERVSVLEGELRELDRLAEARRRTEADLKGAAVSADAAIDRSIEPIGTSARDDLVLEEGSARQLLEAIKTDADSFKRADAARKFLGAREELARTRPGRAHLDSVVLEDSNALLAVRELMRFDT